MSDKKNLNSEELNKINGGKNTDADYDQVLDMLNKSEKDLGGTKNFDTLTFLNNVINTCCKNKNQK